jgi:hypothetical protein
MEFKTPVKLYFDDSPRGTAIVLWKIESTLNINGIQELKPIILDVIDIPMKDFKIHIEIKGFAYKTSTALYLDDVCFYNSKKNTIHFIFKTEPF